MSPDGLDGTASAQNTAGQGYTIGEPPPESDDAGIERLAGLPTLEYERAREAEADRLHVRVSILDRLVEAARPKPEAGTGRFLTLHDPDPWPEPVRIGDLLDATEAAIRRYVILPASAATLISLWVTHTWAAERFRHTPRLGITSPTKRCGKSTLIDLLRILCRRSLKADSISASGTFRLVEALHPLTLLLDEADSFLRENEELRGVLNSGFEWSGSVVRVIEVKDEWQPVAFRTFCPLALAAIGKLPGTLEDRAIPVRLARKTAAESVQRMREAGGRAALDVLARKLCRWATDDGAKLGTDPAIPAALNDREGDLSVPLLSIADAAGSEWGQRARAALLDVFGVRAAEGDDAERGVLLLGDLRTLFVGQSATRMTSADICRYLGEMEERPWPEWRQGKPITAPQLAVALRPFGIRPGNLKLPTGKVAKGYYRETFAEVWNRYLTSDTTLSSEPRGAEPLPRYNVDNITEFREFRSATIEPEVAASGDATALKTNGSSGVADPDPPEAGKEGEPWHRVLN